MPHALFSFQHLEQPENGMQVSNMMHNSLMLYFEFTWFMHPPSSPLLNGNADLLRLVSEAQAADM